MTRLEMISYTAQLVQQNIEKNKGVYRGTMVPNLQSIIDLATLDNYYQINKDQLEVQLRELMRKSGMFIEV